MKFAGSPPNHGALCKYFKMPADCCYKIPTSVGRSFGLDEAVLVEPLSVAVHSVRQAGVQPGDKVVVFGAGTIGLLCAAVAREYGASMITSVDVSRDKLDFAHSFVPNGRVSFATAIPTHSLSSEENALCLRGMHRNAHITETDVTGFDVAIEATGAESCIQMAIYALRVGGSFVQTGLGQRDVSFPISTVSENEINVKGCFRYGPGDYKMALELAFTRKIELKSLITKVFPFEKTVEAWEMTKRGVGIKTLIRGVGYVVEHEHKDEDENKREVKQYRPEYM
jgi:D-xylulose reductase